MIRRITILVAIAMFAIPGVAWGATRHSCPVPRTPTNGFFKSLSATQKVSCSTVAKVLKVWNGQEFPPFRAAGRSPWEYRKPIDNDRRMYTLLHAGGGRSTYMVTLPYG